MTLSKGLGCALGLQAMGVVVTGPGRFDPTLLPPMPPAPTTVNLDVTTLCAMVSEVSNGDPRRPDLQQWAQRVVHWQAGNQLTIIMHDMKAVPGMSGLCLFQHVNTSACQ